MRLRILRLLAFCALALSSLSAAIGAVSVVDDSKRKVTLPQPARRIVSLSPHATEILYAAGAGRYIVGVVEYSDYPPEAKHITSVGSGVALDLERIMSLKPDLVVTWGSGNSAAQIRKLREFGVPVFESEPRDFPTIATSLERLATLAGTDQTGKAAAKVFRDHLQRIQSTYQQRTPVTVFYQIWRNPLMTLNGEHPVSIALRLCGAQNIFSNLPQLAPTVNVEAVLQANPDVIIASSGEQDDVLSGWRRFSGLKAVERGNLFLIDGGIMNRSGPRILDATEALCRQLDLARSRK
ncbi:MAG TPA: cobalamin-binding protein [Noviherbaspirillum sp.]|nr:cobalamin-binding protein [Noviherbaspirillum sp.]